jgi:hypothetical protein
VNTLTKKQTHRYGSGWSVGLYLEDINMVKLYQHEDTGSMTWTTGIDDKRWFEIPTMYEDELPDVMANKDYDDWHENSCVVDGVRMGPKI